MNANKNLTSGRACGEGHESDELALGDPTGLSARLGGLPPGLRRAGNFFCHQPAPTQFRNMSWLTEEWRVSVNRFAPKARKRADRPWFYSYQMPGKFLRQPPREHGDHLFGP